MYLRRRDARREGAVLTVEGLHKRYRGVVALNGFDLQIDAGEIVGLVGHNGAGKTTFVEIVAGLIRPDAGRALVGGFDVTVRPNRARRLIGLAPQELCLYPSLTVRENMRLFGALGGLGRQQLRSAVAQTAEALGLTTELDRPVGLLSGGQRRRTQAATALLHRPRLLLLDEPTAGADPGTRQALLRLVRACADAGTAVCYTTHYLPELADLAASIAVVARGRVIARGSQSRLLADIPDEVRVTLAGGQRRVIRTTDPSRTLADLLAQGHTLRAVDVQPAGLDDLYHALAAEHAGA
jgi:ABC-2 type transport system ATP-binding protein